MSDKNPLEKTAAKSKATPRPANASPGDAPPMAKLRRVAPLRRRAPPVEEWEPGRQGGIGRRSGVRRLGQGLS